MIICVVNVIERIRIFSIRVNTFVYLNDPGVLNASQSIKPSTCSIISGNYSIRLSDISSVIKGSINK